jgi:hypothetical protein
VRLLIRASLAAGIAAATSISLPGTAHAAADQSYYADVEGQYATIEGTIGSAFLGDLFSGQVTIGELEAALDSKGVDKLNKFAAPSGTLSGARGDLVTVGAGPIKLQADHVQATAPVTSGPATRTYVPLSLRPFIDAGVIHGEASAVWGHSVFGRAAASKPVSTVNGDSGYLDFLDLGGQLGGFKNLLPDLLQHPVVSLETLRAHVQTGTVRNADGTHGLSAGGIGGLAAIQILGGASNGGITLGLFNADTGGEKDTAGSRVWATGKPGGSGCSYVVPDTLQAAIGSPANKVALPLSTGQRINLPAGLGYLDVRFTGQSHCETSADGTYAHATGAGVGLSFHLTLPGVTGLPGADLGSFTLTLPDMDHATVKVPKGGIPPSDGPGDGGDDGGDDGDDGGDDPVVDPPSTPNDGGPSAVPTVVDSGLVGSPQRGLPDWALPIGAGVVLAGGIALRQLRRRLILG